MRLRQLLGLVSAFLIGAAVLSASGSRGFGATVSSSSVDQPIEILTPLVTTYEISSFVSVPLRAPVNSESSDIFDVNLISSNWNTSQNVQSAVLGDVSGDTWVDNADIAVIGAHWLETGPPSPPGDVNADNVVNIFDVNFISANWHPNPIPEPTSVMLLALAAPGLWWIRRATRR